MERALAVLKQYYGYHQFRPIQERAIQSILNKKDTFVIMPTGGGKSICYQVPAMLFPGVTLVISPLISLMKDQVDNIEALGIQSAYINSSMSNKEYIEVRNRLLAGEIKILYVAPERLESESFLYLSGSIAIDFIAVDEAHCVSQWGHDFRTSYRNISRYIGHLPKRPVVAAFTATATAEVRKDIVQQLHLHHPNIYRGSFNRSNLHLAVSNGGDKKGLLLGFLSSRRDEAGIIYCNTRKEVERVWEWLNEVGFHALKYHAGLSDRERVENQEDFIYDKANIMVATNAFGMGIDKSNVRYVIHYNLPKNVESYYQEIGRAGRDGLPSQCLLLYSPGDVQTAKYLIEVGTGSEERKAGEYKKLQGMVDYAHTEKCLRQGVLNYFGENHNGECDNCSNCNYQGELVDQTQLAVKVFRCMRQLKRSFGVTTIVDILKGSKNKRMREFGFDQLTTYGDMKEYGKESIKNFINTLIAHNYLDIVEGEFPVIKINEKSVDVLKGDEQVLIKSAPQLAEKEADSGLLEELKKLRLMIAMENNVPSYVVFGDVTLKEMSIFMPTSEDQMMKISGVGQAKFERYGAEFIQCIAQYKEKNQIQSSGVVTKKESSKKEKTTDTTLALIKEGLTLNEIAQSRKITVGTVVNHIQQLVEEGREGELTINWDGAVDPEEEQMILEAMEEVGGQRLKPIKERLDDDIAYDTIKLVILKYQLN